MLDLSYSEIHGALNKADLSGLAGLDIVILRNIMIEPIEPYLRYLAWKSGFNAKVRWGAYDNVLQEAVAAPGGLWQEKTDYVLVFLRLETLSWGLSRGYAGLSAGQIESEVTSVKEYITATLLGIRKQTSAAILWHAFELPSYPALGILDSQVSEGQQAVIGNLNEFLRTSLRNQNGAYFVNLNLCLLGLGARQFYDPRYWHIARAPFTRQALNAIATEDWKFIRSLRGKAKKCLVLDCDGVLWGGIVGEDGLAGIQLGRSHPGSAYYEFQQEVLNLYHRGVILALCSKNDQEDVWEVFRKHPGMILRQEHIATAQINWRDKAANLRQIASDLSIGVDSLAFVDDSDFEVNLVRQALPEVEVIYMPSTRATEFRDILASSGLFDTLTLSTEDRNRGAMYKAEVERKALREEVTDVEAYYRALAMVVEVRFVDEFALPRIAQLTQKTNQFNLTSKRYSEAEIKSFVDSGRSDVIYLRLRDQFGDSGIVGACILTYEGQEAIVDTFLLSCRVLGRGVEDAFLTQVLKLAKKRGCNLAIGEYCATRKNGQVADFYTKQGFDPLEEKAEPRRHRYVCRVNGQSRRDPSFFEAIDSEIDSLQESQT